jgi:hypothetical protein
MAAAVSVRLVLAMGVVNVAFTAGPAAADPTGTGGQFVPLQTRLVDTRTGVGGFTGPMVAGVYQTFTVNGQAGLPSTGVAAVVANVTALNSSGSSGLINVGANSGGSTGTATALLYEPSEMVSNTVVIENGDDGKIKISSSRAIHILVDVQGYFTTGNGARTAPRPRAGSCRWPRPTSPRSPRRPRPRRRRCR